MGTGARRIALLASTLIGTGLPSTSTFDSVVRIQPDDRLEGAIGDSPMSSSFARNVLFVEDVAAIWTDELRKTDGPNATGIKVDRVHDFLRWSRPTPADNKRPHRYEERPMPYPREGRGPSQPVWHGDQEEDLRIWFSHDRGLAPEQLANDPHAKGRLAERLDEWQKDAQNVAKRNR